MRRFFQISTFLFFSIVTAVVFQNCGSYEAMDNPLYGSDLTSTCTGASCPNHDKAIQITIANQAPIALKRPPSTPPASCNIYNCIDVAGYCDTAGYPNSVFYVELRGPTGFPEMRTSAKCDSNGRFRILVGPVASHFDYAALHQLIVTMRGVDEFGDEYDNPTGLHQKQIALTAVE